MVESRHDHGPFRRCESGLTFHRVLKHRPVSDERTVLFWQVAAEPLEDERLDSLSFPAGQHDGPDMFLCWMRHRHDPNPFFGPRKLPSPGSNPPFDPSDTPNR